MTSTDHSGSRTRLASLLLAAAMAVVTVVPLTPVQAQSLNRSSLYYGMGGMGTGGRANNPNQLANTLGLSGGARLNYSCGKFDLGLSWKTLMNGFANLGEQVEGALQAAIAALPLYILQRAQPGLYQLFQNFSQKADLQVAASLKTCEEMEAMIKAGEDPYEDYIKAAQGDLWKVKADAQGDVVQAKLDLNKNEEAQRRGVRWVFGERAGGVDGDPIRPERDLAVAGYNATLNKPTTESAATDYSASAEARNTRLVQAFPTPDDLADFATEVLGDKDIYTCSQADGDCPEPTNAKTATGLGPKYDEDYDFVQPKLEELADTPIGQTVSDAYDRLQEIAAPGMAVTPALLDSLRAMPPATRSMSVNRLSEELAMNRIINKALIARGVLLTGLSLPEVTAASDATRDIQQTIDRLTHYIDDLMYEARVRKELTSETAMTILKHQYRADAESTTIRPSSPSTANPVTSDGLIERSAP